MTPFGSLCLLALLWPFLASVRAATGGLSHHISFPDRNKFESILVAGDGKTETAIKPDEMNALRNIEDFEKYFNLEMPPADFSALSSRIGTERTEKLPQAECALELTTVPLDIPNNVTYFPTCVRVERCRGCCLASHHSCQATAAESIAVKVINANEDVTHNVGGRRRVREARPKYTLVKVERHLACGCQCKLQAGDCDLAIHDYNTIYCQCICRNSGEENACRSSPEHFWENETCRCLCLNPFPCSTNQVFDHDTCSCVLDSLTEESINFLGY